MKRSFLLLILVLVLIFGMSSSAMALSQIGSTGKEVTQIQQVLKDKGYYKGNADGIYGTATKNAVIRFQKDKGLKVDGIVGSQTLKALGISKSGNQSGEYSSSDYNLLARVISAEARGEPYIGQVAVGAVILNRIEHPSFPDTLAGVVYQKGAFSCMYDGQINAQITDSAYNAARDALNGLDPSGGAIYYYNPSTATSKWIYSRPVITQIGDHVFCN